MPREGQFPRGSAPHPTQEGRSGPQRTWENGLFLRMDRSSLGSRRGKGVENPGNFMYKGCRDGEDVEWSAITGVAGDRRPEDRDRAGL